MSTVGRPARLLLLLHVTLAAAGCGSDVCQQAAEKQLACIDRLDCRKADPMQQQSCEQQKQALKQAAAAPEIACAGPLEDRANQILACPLDPRTCDCSR